MQAPISDEDDSVVKPPIVERIQTKFGIDFSVFRESETWKGFAIGIVMFSLIGYSGLSIFGLASDSYGVDRSSSRLAPDFEMETLNRTNFEQNLTNETGWFELEQHLGKVIILDFMAHDCLACHGVQAHLEENMQLWNDLDTEYELLIVAVGS